MSPVTRIGGGIAVASRGLVLGEGIRVPSVAGGAGPVTITETFTGTAGTTLPTYDSPDHAFSWVQHPSAVSTGNAVLSNGNRARMNPASNTGSNASYLDITPASANYKVAADFVVMTQPSPLNTGITVRMDPTATTWYAARYLLSTGQWSISKAVAGAFSTIGTPVTATLTNGLTYRVEIEVVGTTIVMRVDSVDIITTTDSAITAAGKPGIRPSDFGGTNTTGVHFDNWAYTGL